MPEDIRVSGLWSSLKLDPSHPNVCAWCGSNKIMEIAPKRKRGTYYCSPQCTKLFYRMIGVLRHLSERRYGLRAK